MPLSGSGRSGGPVGFMDSGLGGLSVLREAIRLMPSEDFIYFGDSLNAPYGTKPVEEVCRLAFDSVEYLLGRGAKAITIACNTATAAAVAKLRAAYPELIIVGIEPAIKPAVLDSHGGRILVMATPNTLKQDKFLELMGQYADQAEIVPVPCAGLMEFVERGDLEGTDLDDYFTDHLQPFLSEDTETIVLGCTHYPFLKQHLRRFLKGRDITLIDGSRGTAMELKRRLRVRGLLKEEDVKGHVEIVNSIPGEEIRATALRLLNLPYSVTQ